MSNDDRIDTFVLQEFRLLVAASADDVARIVASFSDRVEPVVPLLTSIDDQRDVATIRAMRPGDATEGDPAERAALQPLISSWQPARRYGPRITERSERPPTYYRLAVTESGINTPDSGPAAAPTRKVNATSTSTQIDLLWIGLPLGAQQGLLALVGGDNERTATRADPDVWPLPFSRLLGVRIYESRH
jgi:hypothetical protein